MPRERGHVASVSSFVGGSSVAIRADYLGQGLEQNSITARRSQARTPSKYALTRIYLMEYIKGMESVFEIIAEPNRRAILSLLASSQQSVGEIERQLRVPQPTVSKH